MKRFPILLIIFFGIMQQGCSQKSITSSEWLKQNTIELQPNGAYDFSKLKDVLKNRRIVALGESSHGLGEYYALKSALVIYLHKELGYDVIAMEGGLGDINLAYTDVDTISAKNLRNYTLFGNFKAQEVDTLFSYIKQTRKAERPLIYSGYDTQFSSNYKKTKITRLLAPLNKTMSDSFSRRIYSFQKSFQAARNNDSVAYIKHRDIFIKNAKNASSIIKNKKDSLIRAKAIDDKDYEVIQRTFDMFIRSTNLSFADRFQTMELRDELMAENLNWLLDEVYADKKIIIWAHNGHIEKNNSEGYNYKLMGHYLKEKYKTNYYALGLFAYEGEAYQFWTRDKTPFKNNTSLALENSFFKTNKSASFLDLSNVKQNDATNWLFEVNTGFEPENGGQISFIPMKRFDGILTLKTSGAPTYNN